MATEPGTCEHCGESEFCGPNSTVCMPCAFSPKRRAKKRKERGLAP